MTYQGYYCDNYQTTGQNYRRMNCDDFGVGQTDGDRLNQYYFHPNYPDLQHKLNSFINVHKMEAGRDGDTDHKLLVNFYLVRYLQLEIP